MRRRNLLKLSATTAMLAAPHIATAQRERTLRFVPTPDLSELDPVFTPARSTHNHAYLVFDTLYCDSALEFAPYRRRKMTPRRLQNSSIISILSESW